MISEKSECVGAVDSYKYDLKTAPRSAPRRTKWESERWWPFWSFCRMLLRRCSMWCRNKMRFNIPFLMGRIKTTPVTVCWIIKWTGGCTDGRLVVMPPYTCSGSLFLPSFVCRPALIAANRFIKRRSLMDTCAVWSLRVYAIWTLDKLVFHSSWEKISK